MELWSADRVLLALKKKFSGCQSIVYSEWLWAWARGGAWGHSDSQKAFCFVTALLVLSDAHRLSAIADGEPVLFPPPSLSPPVFLIFGAIYFL